MNDHLYFEIKGACRWCDDVHPGVCPKVAAIEYQPDGQTVQVVHFFPPQVAPTPAEPSSDEVYRERLLRKVGEASVNASRIKTAGSAELDELGEAYNEPRGMMQK